MIEQRVVNGSLTEIYINGGGYFMTQSYPTNFHVFLTKKILTAAESIADWMEVSEAEKARIEATDAAWERPPQGFIDIWEERCLLSQIYTNDACGKVGCWNESTGYFELNTLKDITYKQAMPILANAWKSITQGNADYAKYLFSQERECRTYFPLYYYQVNSFKGSAAYMFWHWLGVNLEVVRFGNPEKQWQIAPFNDWSYAFNNNKKLREVRELQVINTAPLGRYMFENCIALETVELGGIGKDVSFTDCPLLSLYSLRYIVTNAANTAPITITVHADIYAALQGSAGTYPFNGGSREEWMQLYEEALERQITFGTQ